MFPCSASFPCSAQALAWLALSAPGLFSSRNISGWLHQICRRKISVPKSLFGFSSYISWSKKRYRLLLQTCLFIFPETVPVRAAWFSFFLHLPSHLTNAECLSQRCTRHLASDKLAFQRTSHFTNEGKMPIQQPLLLAAGPCSSEIFLNFPVDAAQL